MKNTTTLAISLLFFVQVFAQQIPSYFWGINHWMPKQIPITSTSGYPNGAIDCNPNIQQMVKDDGSVFYRIGADGYDTFGTAIGNAPSNNDYITAIQTVKAVNPNAKFIVQVPFKSGVVNTTQAGQLVLNIKNFFGNNNNIYYAIGNEWDRYTKPSGGKYTSAQIKNLLMNYAVAMKSQDASIRIIGPAVSYFYAPDSSGNVILQRLIGGSDNITMVMSGTGQPSLDGVKYYIDVVDFHTYAGGSNGNMLGINAGNYNTYYSNTLNYPTGNFITELNTLVGYLNTVNTSRSSSPLTWAITEMNVCFKNPPAPVPGNIYTNSTEGIGCRSFFAGQYWADIMSTMLKVGTNPSNAKVEFVMPWAIHESGGDGDSLDLSMTKGPASCSIDPTELSTYWHYQLMSQYFYGKYFSGTSSIAPSVKTFASVVDSTGFYVMILNRNATSYPFSIGFAGSYASGSEPLKLQFNFTSPPLGIFLGTSSTYTGDTITANTTVLLQFDCNGNKLMKKVYSLQDALVDNNPHLKQIGNNNVDPQIAACGMPGIGGVINSNTTYSNTTVYITSNILLNGGNTLTFNNAVVIISPNVKIKSNPNSAIVIKNGTVMFGCDGKQWKGIELNGNYHAGDKLLIQNSFIFNAKNPVVADKIGDMKILNSVFANGETAISLNRSEAFTITGNLIGNFKTGIKTTNTKPGYVSAIKENRIIEVLIGADFFNDSHDKLDILCNQFRFASKGIYSRSTTLKQQGDVLNSAGNDFTRLSVGTPMDYIDHTGSSTSYYYGPLEAAKFLFPYVMNIPKIQATADQLCAKPFATTCKTFVGIQENSLSQSQFLIYPNPSNGNFTIKLNDLPKGNWTLNVHDVLGRLISSQKVNTALESTVLQINSKGMYFVSLENGKDRLTQKVIVE